MGISYSRAEGINSDTKFMEMSKVPMSIALELYNKYDQAKSLMIDMFKHGLLFVDMGMISYTMYKAYDFQYIIENKIGYSINYYHLEKENPLLMWMSKYEKDTGKEIKDILKKRYPFLEGY